MRLPYILLNVYIYTRSIVLCAVEDNFGALRTTCVFCGLRISVFCGFGVRYYVYDVFLMGRFKL